MIEPIAVEPIAVEPIAVEPIAVEPIAVEPIGELSTGGRLSWIGGAAFTLGRGRSPLAQ